MSVPLPEHVLSPGPLRNSVLSYLSQLDGAVIVILPIIQIGKTEA